MPYVPGYTPDPEEPPKPSLVGFLTRDNGAVLYATRYGRRFKRDVAPNGLVSFAEAAALVHRQDPQSGEWKPVTRLAVYQWANAGKLTTRRAREPGGSVIMHVRLSELREFAELRGFKFRRRATKRPAR